MRPSRTGRPAWARSPDRKPATTSARRMPSSHLQLLIPCGAIRAGAPARSSPRPDGRCGCRRRIDRMLATDPKEQARARPTAKCSGAMSQPFRPGPRSPPTTPSSPSGGREDLQPRDLGTSDRPPARAASPNRVSLPHRLSTAGSATRSGAAAFGDPASIRTCVECDLASAMGAGRALRCEVQNASFRHPADAGCTLARRSSARSDRFTPMRVAGSVAAVDR